VPSEKDILEMNPPEGSLNRRPRLRSPFADRFRRWLEVAPSEWIRPARMSAVRGGSKRMTGASAIVRSAAISSAEKSV